MEGVHDEEPGCDLRNVAHEVSLQAKIPRLSPGTHVLRRPSQQLGEVTKEHCGCAEEENGNQQEHHICASPVGNENAHQGGTESVFDPSGRALALGNASQIPFLPHHGISEMEGFGELSVTNLKNAIEEARSMDLGRLLFGLRIPHVGTTVAQLISENFQDLEVLKKVQMQDLEVIDGLGPKIAMSVFEWFTNERNVDLISRLQYLGVNPKSESPLLDDQDKTLLGMTIVVTGRLQGLSREEARKIIKERGGKSPGSVSAKTTYLLAGEGGGSKLEQAEKFDVPVIDETAFENLIKNGNLPK